MQIITCTILSTVFNTGVDPIIFIFPQLPNNACMMNQASSTGSSYNFFFKKIKVNITTTLSSYRNTTPHFNPHFLRDRAKYNEPYVQTEKSLLQRFHSIGEIFIHSLVMPLNMENEFHQI